MPQTKTRRASRRRNQATRFKQLEKYLGSVAEGTIKQKMFTLCVRASASKCFEFNLALPEFASEKNSFFALSSLRGICEDLIVLRFISTIPPADRQALLVALMGVESATRVKLQGEFFTSFRPQQPVLNFRDVDERIKRAEAASRAIWNKHGWPKLAHGYMPQLRQIAERQGQHQLAVLYDYLYRLTSGGVHFSVQSLLRSGWGPSPTAFVFSTKNFDRYFSEYCSLYGAFLFCLYFEFFSGVLRPGAKERAIVAKIREGILMTRRWPEMVTYEEMNVKPPERGEAAKMIASAIQAVTRKRLIPKSANYRNRRSGEARLMSEMFKILAEANTTTSTKPT